MFKSVQDVVRGMNLPPGYNFEALQQLADIADHQKAEIERLRAAGCDMIAEIINSNAAPDMGELNGWMAMFGFGDPQPSVSEKWVWKASEGNWFCAECDANKGVGHYPGCSNTTPAPTGLPTSVSERGNDG